MPLIGSVYILGPAVSLYMLISVSAAPLTRGWPRSFNLLGPAALTAMATVILLWEFWLTSRRNLPRQGRRGLLELFTHVLPSATSLVLALRLLDIGRATHPIAPAAWVIDLALGVFVVLVISGRRAAVMGFVQTRRLYLAVSGVDPAEANMAELELAHAIDTLEQLEVIAPADAERARAAPLGWGDGDASRAPELAEFLSGVGEWHPSDWWRLELAALRPEPALAAAFARIAPAGISDPPRAEADPLPRRRPAPLWSAAAVLGPGLGAALMIAWAVDGRGATSPLPISALLAVVAMAYRALVSHPARIGGRGLALTQALPAAITIAIALLGEGISWLGSRWVLLLAASLGTALHTWWATSGHPRPAPEEVGFTAGLAALAERTRGDLLLLRNAAIDELVERGRIPESTASFARVVHLGDLARTFAPGAPDQ